MWLLENLKLCMSWFTFYFYETALLQAFSETWGIQALSGYFRTFSPSLEPQESSKCHKALV